MTVADVAPSYTLSDQAQGQLDGCGIALSEIYRVLQKPTRQQPWPGGYRYFGYGIWVIVQGSVVDSVGLEGARAHDWEERALERALSGAADVATADALLQRDAVERFGDFVLEPSVPAQRQPKKRLPVRAEAPVRHVSILDQIHPALRAEVTRQVDGDFSRVVVESPTNVTILPRR